MNLNAPITRDEMETHIYLNPDGEILLDTSIQKHIRKCEKLGWEMVDKDCYEGRVVAARFKAPERCLTLRKVAGGMSEEQKEKLSERMKAVSAARKEAAYE